MTQSLCPRCRSVVPSDDPNQLVFCSTCGAPQVRLSEELRSQAEEQLAGQSGEGATPQPPDRDSVLWPALLRTSAMVSAAFSLFVFLLPPIPLIVPPIVLAIYAMRHRGSAMSAGLGASVGAVCGLFTAVCLVLLQALALCALRFGAHSMAQFNDAFNTILLHTKAQAEAQSGAGSAAFLARILSVPEFRVGFFLAGVAGLAAMILLLCTLSGAFAGYLRRSPRAA